MQLGNQRLCLIALSGFGQNACQQHRGRGIERDKIKTAAEFAAGCIEVPVPGITDPGPGRCDKLQMRFRLELAIELELFDPRLVAIQHDISEARRKVGKTMPMTGPDCFFGQRQPTFGLEDIAAGSGGIAEHRRVGWIKRKRSIDVAPDPRNIFGIVGRGDIEQAAVG